MIFVEFVLSVLVSTSQHYLFYLCVFMCMHVCEHMHVVMQSLHVCVWYVHVYIYMYDVAMIALFYLFTTLKLF